MDQSKEHSWKFNDPDFGNPARKGMLLSSEIEKFCKNRLLIEDWDPSCLRPAAYTLKIGDEYADSDGSRGRLSEQNASFLMRPNSIVFVSTKEKLNLPFYIAARFNLRVKWVYKGILLGTGPQVDPGFKGHLSCPLYNLTDRPVRIRRGDKFATIDFERTTDFCKGKSWEEIKTLVQKDRDVDRLNLDGETFLLFPQQSFQPLQHLENDAVSSLTQLEKEVMTWQNIGVGLVISFFALVVAMAAFGANMFREVNSNSKDLAELKARVEYATNMVDRQEQSINVLKQEAQDTASKLSKRQNQKPTK